MDVKKFMNREERICFGKMNKAQREAFLAKKEEEIKKKQQVVKKDQEVPVKAVEIELPEPVKIQELDLEKKEIKKEVEESQEHNYVYLNTIWDATYSASEIFKPLYYAYKKCVEIFKNLHAQYESVVMKYGLTVLNTDVEAVKFQNGSHFTEDADEFLEALLNMRFEGGSSDGVEAFNEAIEEGIRITMQESKEDANCGIIFFTDSMTKKQSADFTMIDGRPVEKGLRFAMGYANSNKYGVNCKIVDKENKETENAKNTGTIIMAMQDLFEYGISEQMIKMVDDVMNQASVPLKFC